MPDATPAISESPCFAMPYFGGKAYSSASGTGKWIASMLPMRVCYCEPFAGMIGVLLQRPKANSEIVNDRCGMLAAFWRCVREKNEEFFWRIWSTPHCREFLDEARSVRDRMDAGEEFSDEDKAWAAYALLSGNYMHDIGNNHATKTFRISLQRSAFAPKQKVMDRLKAVAKRVENVQIENTDAIELLGRLSHYEYIVIYADPPYLCQNGNAYGQMVEDWDALHDALKAQKGLVAVSGYEGDHDALGWRKHTLRTITTAGSTYTLGNTPRVECLWTNYEPEKPVDMFEWKEG